jgi:hypothetical protein
VSLKLTESVGASIARLHVVSEGAAFEARRDPDSDQYVTSASGSAIPSSGRMVRATREETKEILLAELARGGRHPLYTKAVKAIGTLWA